VSQRGENSAHGRPGRGESSAFWRRKGLRFDRKQTTIATVMIPPLPCWLGLMAKFQGMTGGCRTWSSCGVLVRGFGTAASKGE